MKQKTHFTISVCVLMAAIALLLVVLFVLPVHAGGGIMLRPPFDGTYRTTAYFDHDEPSYAIGADGYIQIYNGERVPSSYANKTGEPYPYDGHDGWDWSMITGTNVLAAAAGTVVVSQNDWGTGGYGHVIIISHDNGYYTMYAHLHQRLVERGAMVAAGQHIAESGSSGTTAAHLHFGVRHGGWANTTYAVDPFGWRGDGRDPLFDYNSKVSTCLWRSRDEDPISCADAIVEDGGRGFSKSGTWFTSTLGNGYRMHYTRTVSITNTTIYATWRFTASIRGPYKVYAYIPSQYATTLTATYRIWTVNGWQSAHVNQLNYSDQWVLLGTYTLPTTYARVEMRANTGESPARWIAADGMKFRQYRVYLPLVLNNHSSGVSGYGQLMTNGGFTGDATDWRTSRSNGPEPIAQPYAGFERGAWMGRYNSNQDQMYQFVTPAAPADYATLAFSWWMSTFETSTTRDYDFLYVRIRDADGNLLQTIRTITNRSPQEQWHREYFDLRAYVGQTIRISFEAATNRTRPTNFWIDEVDFLVADR